MSRISQRELWNLGIDLVSPAESSAREKNAPEEAEAILIIAELFDLNPHASNINPSSDEGNKLRLKVTIEMQEKGKYRILILN